MYTSILFFLLLLLLIWKKIHTRKYPPGPYQWPLIGNLLELNFAHAKFPHLALDKLAKKYGSIMSLQIGVHKVVVLSDYETMKELLHHPNFTGRYAFAFSKDRSFGAEIVSGLIWSSGSRWQTMSQFSLRHLRDFGFGKSASMEAVIMQEVEGFVQKMKSKAGENGGIIQILDNFSFSLVNILWSYIVGSHFSYLTQTQLQSLMDANEEVVRRIKFNNVNVAYPGVRKLFPTLSGYRKQMDAFTVQQNLFKELIYSHKGENSDNFVERFLKNIKRTEGDPKSHFTEESLIVLLMDFFLAGIETPTSMLTYAIFFMMLYPEAQVKVQEEIHDVIHPERHPTMADLEKYNNFLFGSNAIGKLYRMPYTQATVHEIYRLANVLPIPPPRTSQQDFVYKDFVIPQGAAVMFNLYSVQMDEEYWKDPFNFRPERFLAQNGKKFISNERVSGIFGFGKRICPGESLARTSVFLFLVTLLKEFKFGPVPGQPPPSMIPRDCFTIMPQPFDVVIESTGQSSDFKSENYI